MIKRITKLILDWRLDYLARTPEFHSIKHKLMCMLDRLSTGEELKNGNEELINLAEHHIELIDPRWVQMTIEGEEREVFVITKPTSE